MTVSGLARAWFHADGFVGRRDLRSCETFRDLSRIRILQPRTEAHRKTRILLKRRGKRSHQLQLFYWKDLAHQREYVLVPPIHDAASNEVCASQWMRFGSHLIGDAKLLKHAQYDA